MQFNGKLLSVFPAADQISLSYHIHMKNQLQFNALHAPMRH